MKENALKQCIKTFTVKINNKCLIQNKSWIKFFFAMFILGILMLSLFNYYTDPYNYFSKQYNGVEHYSQYYKTKYILESPEKYNCFIIGGSNSGVLDPEQIDDYTNYRTYSMTFEVGNWYNYYLYTRFLVEHTGVKCIILHLSSTEVNHDKESIESIEDRKAPALTKHSLFEKLKETSSFLLKAIFDKEGVNRLYIKRNGMYDWSWFGEREEENPQEYAQKYVLAEYEETISKLDDVSLDDRKIEEALDYAEQVKKLCDDSDVELIVISGPVFISKRARFECNDYYDYMERLVDIMDIYDFSDITEENANPYNFYNDGHYNDRFAKKIIDIILGEDTTRSDLGIKLTKENVVDYLIHRKEKFEVLKDEYERTGTIEYQSYDNISRLVE